MPPKKRFIPQTPPAEQEPATIEYVTNLVNQLRNDVSSRQQYAKHADLHALGNKDPINFGTGTARAPGAFGYNFVVDANWATQVGLGLGTEGQSFPTGTGSTFKMYSTVAGAVTQAATDFASTIPGTIFVRPGNYAETITIATGQYVAIIGAGRQSVIIGGLTTSGGSTASVPATFIADSTASIWMTGFTLKTNHSASGTASNGLKATSATDVTIWDCHLVGNTSGATAEYAVSFGGAGDRTKFVHDCTVQNHGVTASTNNPTIITDCYAKSGTIAYALTEDCIINGGQIVSYTTGVSLLDGANDVTIEGLQFVLTTTAVKCAGNNAISVLIDGCTVDSGTTFFDFSSLTFSATTTGGITVSNNRGAVSTAFAFPSSAIAMPMDLHDNAWWGASGAGTIALTSGAIHPMQRMSNNWIDSSSTTPAQEIIDGALNRKFTGGIYWVENTSPLTIGVTACTIRFGDTDVAVARQTVALTGSSATNYIEINSSGTLSSNTTAFTAGTYHVLKVVTTAAGTATYSSHTDVGGVLFVGGSGSSVPTAGFWPIMNAATTLTIASGAITVTQDHHTLIGEGSLNDTLSTINGSVNNKFLVLRPEVAAGNTITLDESGNIKILHGDSTSVAIGSGANYTEQYALLWYDPDATKWLAVFPGVPLDKISDITGSTYVRANTDTSIDLAGLLNLSVGTKDIASGSLVAESTIVHMDTEGAAATDDLVDVQPVAQSTLFFITSVSASRVITARNNSGSGASGYKLFTQGGYDIVLDDPAKVLVLVYDNRLDSANGGWHASLIGAPASKSVTATVFGGSASTTIQRAMFGPMLQGGTILGCKVKKADTITAMGATAWIGDIHLITAANSDTSSLGTTIFTAKPTITNTHFYSAAATLATTTFAAGDWFAFFTDQIGTNAGNILMTLEVVYNS